MKERILEFLRNENKTSAQLAEEIGVQASGISHIISGRNNPSLDFVLKMLEKYKFLSTEWLLFGKGSMYTEAKIPTLFGYENATIKEPDDVSPVKEKYDQEIDFQGTIEKKVGKLLSEQKPASTSDVVKIVWFYANNSFEEFIPRK
jgi:transcriptional regulator with XRE-family HTH domain